MPEVHVSVGSNMDRETNVREALCLMEEHYGPLVVSTLYEAESVGFSGPNFYNLVVGFETDRALPEVMQALSDMENRRGRRRGGCVPDDRPLDLDILLYGDTVDHNSPCDLPRPDILNYAFVLCSLAEIAGERVHPECGCTYAELWSSFSDNTQKLWPVTDIRLDSRTTRFGRRQRATHALK
ncbi:MAG: 2-amino-4-hydroxy-6-hydroxymethyldihydropteridine pyrophosphokinase [Gammaproteobacteria bacterium]|nr:2-amino-4-hydroxy-6-hydroxymethyldihydropteridine pyrophosphokinase [Gammaproteobacteria bacterium]